MQYQKPHAEITYTGNVNENEPLKKSCCFVRLRFVRQGGQCRNLCTGGRAADGERVVGHSPRQWKEPLGSSGGKLLHEFSSKESKRCGHRLGGSPRQVQHASIYLMPKQTFTTLYIHFTNEFDGSSNSDNRCI